MMYSEFVAGTGCRENAHNYKVFEDLEVMYMNSNLTKEQIYEYGKKLVDNSKSPEILKLEAEIEEEIESLKGRIESCQREIAYRKEMVRIFMADGDKEMARSNRNVIKYEQDEIKAARARIAACKWVLNS